jgi:hypothetical protein
MINDDGGPIKMSLNGADSRDVIDMLENELSPLDYDDDSVCRVELWMNFDEQSLGIKFTEHLQDSDLEDEYVQIDLFVTDQMLIGVEHVLEYACSYDECDLDFIDDHIDWLMDASYPELLNKLAALILGDGEKTGE